MLCISQYLKILLIVKVCVGLLIQGQIVCSSCLKFSSKVIELPFILSIILKSFCRFSSRNHCYRRWALPRLLINTPALTVLVNCIIRQDLRLLQMFGLYCYKKTPWTFGYKPNQPQYKLPNSQIYTSW